MHAQHQNCDLGLFCTHRLEKLEATLVGQTDIYQRHVEIILPYKVHCFMRRACLKIADTLSEIIDMAADTTTEFERVARLVGKQGKVDERIELPMMKGSWQKIVNSSNALADDLISPMNEMIRVIGSVAEGDLHQQVPMELDGLKLRGQFLKSAEIVNTMVTRLGSFASEVTRVAREVGTEGILGGQAKVKGMKERVSMLGGELKIDSAPGKGTTLTIAMPLD